MQKHLELHPDGIDVDEDLYKCPFPHCNYGSIQMTNLRNHINKHTKSKPWECKYLDCTFRTGHRGSLTRHRQSKNHYVKSSQDDSATMHLEKDLLSPGHILSTLEEGIFDDVLSSRLLPTSFSLPELHDNDLLDSTCGVSPPGSTQNLPNIPEDDQSDGNGATSTPFNDFGWEETGLTLTDMELPSAGPSMLAGSSCVARLLVLDGFEEAINVGSIEQQSSLEDEPNVDGTVGFGDCA